MPKPEGNGKGLWISIDILANTDLIWTEKALLAYMRFRADKGGEFWEFNHNIAQALDMSESTVKRGLSRLAELGLVEGKKGDGTTMRVRMAADWYAEKGLPAGSNMRGAGQVEPCGAVQAEPRQGSERTPTQLKLTPATGQNEPCIRRVQGIGTTETENEEDKASSSSISKKGENTPNLHPQNHADGLAGQDMAPPPPAVLARLRDVATAWARQVCELTSGRVIVHKKHDAQGEWKEVRLNLRKSSPAGFKDADALLILGIAMQERPDSNPVQSFRSLLRACAAGSDRVDKLQTYGGIAKNNAIGLTNIVKLAGNWKEEPATYARECAGSMWEPLTPANTSAEGLDALADEIKGHLMRDVDTWDGTEWRMEWLEAAARCREAGVDAGYYAACAHWYQLRGSLTAPSYPLPWIAADMSPATLAAFKPLFAEDRMNAWTAGAVWDTDKQMSRSVSFYEYCIGVRVAKAVATGEAEFRTKTCLRCAAMELTHMPDLVRAVPEWTGTAEALAAKLLEVAGTVKEDIPPTRTSSCGEEGEWHCSLVKCAFDLTRASGCYAPEFEWEHKKKQAGAANWAKPATTAGMTPMCVTDLENPNSLP